MLTHPLNPCRFLLNPSACLDEHMLQFKFLGILMGVAIRTKKPLDLHLAPLVWKQLCCIPLQLEDLEEVDLLYVQTLKSILHIEDSGITEDNFHEVGRNLKLLTGKEVGGGGHPLCFCLAKNQSEAGVNNMVGPHRNIPQACPKDSASRQAAPYRGSS